MTGRQRLLKVVSGEVPDRVPFSPNIGQWFDAHKTWNRLPPDLSDCADEIDAMKRLGADIFSRRCGNFTKETHGNELSLKWEKPESGHTRVSVHTPHGTLTKLDVFSAESHTTFEHEHLWKDFEKDYSAIRYYLENTEYHFDAQKHQEVDARVGDDGLVIVGGQETPLKKIINLAGPQNALVWAMEGDTRLDELVEIHTEKCLTYAREVAASSAFGMMSMDNLCALFFSPPLFNRYCRNYFRRMGEVLHAKGKFWCSHACGHVRRLRDMVAEVELDGLEGPPHAPLGDIDLAEFRDTVPYRRHIVWGGMTCNEQEIAVDAGNRIREHVSTLFGRLRPFHRFVFSSACNTSVRTPYDNLRHLRDACHQFGRAS